MRVNYFHQNSLIGLLSPPRTTPNGVSCEDVRKPTVLPQRSGVIDVDIAGAGVDGDRAGGGVGALDADADVAGACVGVHPVAAAGQDRHVRVAAAAVDNHDPGSPCEREVDV